MPDVRNCRRCGRVFNYIGGAPICQTCKDKEEEDFKRVKEYLYQNPGATMSEVSTVLEISVERITRFLKEGRLEITSSDANLILECERCGKSIKTGRYCDECSRELSRDLSSTAREISQSITSSGITKKKEVEMRYLKKDNRG